jgi:hypothetical protein
MKNILPVLLVAIISFTSCKNSSQAMGADKIEPSKSKPAKQTNMMKISFISKGAGIDNDLRDTIEKNITDFNSKNDLNLSYNKKGWGREGEVDYFIGIENLSTQQKKSFTSLIKETIGSSDMAFLTFN